MRKYLLRWWYTPDWPREQYERMIRHWNGDWTPIRRAPEPFTRLFYRDAYDEFGNRVVTVRDITPTVPAPKLLASRRANETRIE